MANLKGSQNNRNFMYSGKNALLPPKIPIPGVSAPYSDCVSISTIGQKTVQRPWDGTVHHQRTSSESVAIEEQPFWLDDLLNEPDTPVRKNYHRRSSSDSFTYIDLGNSSNHEFSMHGGAHDFGYHKDTRGVLSYPKVMKQKSLAWDSFLVPCTQGSGRPLGFSYGIQDKDEGSSVASGKKNFPDSQVVEAKRASPEKKDICHSKPTASEIDSKRAKQQFAQRSRVRKLQYIAELEKNVQTLQAEGSEVSAELDFLNQQNLILTMENKALKQRLESLAQEHLIKRMEHEVLEREIGRLRAWYQQQLKQPLSAHRQQCQKQPSSSHRRASHKDLESQLANLTLKQNDASLSNDSSIGSNRI